MKDTDTQEWDQTKHSQINQTHFELQFEFPAQKWSPEFLKEVCDLKLTRMLLRFVLLMWSRSLLVDSASHRFHTELKSAMQYECWASFYRHTSCPQRCAISKSWAPKCFQAVTSRQSLFLSFSDAALRRGDSRVFSAFLLPWTRFWFVPFCHLSLPSLCLFLCLILLLAPVSHALNFML